MTGVEASSSTLRKCGLSVTPEAVTEWIVRCRLCPVVVSWDLRCIVVAAAVCRLVACAGMVGDLWRVEAPTLVLCTWRCVGLARLTTGNRYRLAIARRAGMGAFTRINDFGGAERQSNLYANALLRG